MLSKEKIKYIKKLHEKKYRKEQGVFLVEGRKMILELLASDWEKYIEELYVSQELFSEIQRGIISNSDDISRVSTLEKNYDGIAIVRQRDPATSGGGQRNMGGEFGDSWILILDGIRDPGNMGTILRTAAWFGITKIVCSQDCVEIYNPKVVSATMGAIFHLNIEYINLENFYTKNSLPVYGAELGGENISQIMFPKSGVIVMGSESHGISEISRNYMTQGILIPKTGYGESLNVGIATGIILAEITK